MLSTPKELYMEYIEEVCSLCDKTRRMSYNYT